MFYCFLLLVAIFLNIILFIVISLRDKIHEQIKSRLKSGNACYHSVQNILSSSLLSKNIKI